MRSYQVRSGQIMMDLRETSENQSIYVLPSRGGATSLAEAGVPGLRRIPTLHSASPGYHLNMYCIHCSFPFLLVSSLPFLLILLVPFRHSEIPPPDFGHQHPHDTLAPDQPADFFTHAERPNKPVWRNAPLCGRSFVEESGVSREIS
jgi:hypothetical protein